MKRYQQFILFSIIFFFGILTNPLNAEEKDYLVKWGLILPLTGHVAESGIDLKRGYQLAIADLKDSNITHQLIIEDSQLQPKLAISAAQKLINIDQVDVLISVWDTAEVVAPLAERHDLLHLAIRWNSDTAENFPNTFTFESTYKTYVQKFLKLFQEQDVKNLAIIGQESTGWNLAEEQFLKHAKNYGINVVSHQRYLADENNFNLIALRAIQAKPDIIIINDISKSLELLTNKIKSLNPQMPVTGYLGMPINYSLFEGMFYVNQLKLDPVFARRFQEHFGTPVYTRAQLAYDQMSLVGNLFKSFKTKPTTSELVEKLKEIKSYQGMSGLITNTNGKVFETECEIRQIVEGRDVVKNLN